MIMKNIIIRVLNHIKWQFNFFLKITLPQCYYSLLLKSQVYSGPFIGMRYIRSSTGSVILPKLIGTYEDELHTIINNLKLKQYSLFIDVGAAEGYYVVGIGKYIFNNLVPVIAYESTISGQNKIKSLSILNAFTNVTVKGTCDTFSLGNDICENRSFILIDVEGAEYYLLDTQKIDFTFCDILVEVHKNQIYNLNEIIIERFKFTHNIINIKPWNKKIPKNISYPIWVFNKAKFVTNEFRGEQSWLWLESKKNSS